MKGMYSHEEMINMRGIISSVKQLSEGFIIRQIGSTVNYYRRESDGSWTNYECKTIG